VQENAFKKRSDLMSSLASLFDVKKLPLKTTNCAIIRDEVFRMPSINYPLSIVAIYVRLLSLSTSKQNERDPSPDH
jgi:hypothetical protein